MNGDDRNYLEKLDGKIEALSKDTQEGFKTTREMIQNLGEKYAVQAERFKDYEDVRSQVYQNKSEVHDLQVLKDLAEVAKRLDNDLNDYGKVRKQVFENRDEIINAKSSFNTSLKWVSGLYSLLVIVLTALSFWIKVGG